MVLADLVKEVTQCDLVVVEQGFLLGGEKPLAECQAGSRYGGGVVLHVQLVGELVRSELSHWKRKRRRQPGSQIRSSQDARLFGTLVKEPLLSL